MDTAQTIADTLREIADAIELASKGDEKARKLVLRHVDYHWHGIVVGAGIIRQLMSPADEFPDDGELLEVVDVMDDGNEPMHYDIGGEA